MVCVTRGGELCVSGEGRGGGRNVEIGFSDDLAGGDAESLGGLDVE